MFFNTWPFAVFAVVVVAAYALSPPRIRAWVLILAGLAFYANAGPANLLVIVGATLGTYAVARLLQTGGERMRGAVLAGGAITALTLLLCYFKYARWLSAAFGAAVPGWHVPVVGPLIAPLAISFFTFEFIHFIVEVHAGRIKEFTFERFLLFALFFPTMVAGPIKRYRMFSPQVQALRMATGPDLHAALYRILSGLFKKIAIADPVSLFATPIFHPDPSYTAATYALALVAGSVKVYYDLGGYTDMAIGFGLLFGVRVPENFAHPFRASNLLEFWQRWHMSLTSWVRDYIFLPLTKRTGGGIRIGGIRPGVLVSMVAVMIIIGVWHGAGLHFVIWGVWNGACLAFYHLWRAGVSRRIAWLSAPNPVLRVLSVGLTYASFTFGLGWIPAPSTADAFSIYRAFL
jgi:alginate O-acetyltransferase complex protein AlgI